MISLKLNLHDSGRFVSQYGEIQYDETASTIEEGFYSVASYSDASDELWWSERKVKGLRFLRVEK